MSVILSRYCGHCGQRLTTRVIAERAHVSTKTVQRFFSGIRMADKSNKRIMRAIHELSNHER